MLFCPLCRIALGPTQPVCPRDGHTGAEAPVPEIPADLARRFTVIDVFARGRTGTSYLVDEPETGRRGLLKLLHTEVASALSDRQRIARELAKQTSLDEPSLVLPIASGETGGVSWLFREWVEGVALRIRLSRSGPPPIAETVQIGASLARALDALHRAGLLHRDLKSGHVLLVPQDGAPPAVRLIDAGIAAKLDSAKELPVYGTAAYVCPEQTQGKLVSFRSDLYALGAFLFEMLTGAPPFVGATDDETLAMHASAPVPALPASVPAELAALVTSLLSKEPKNRPFSAQQVARALDAGFASPSATSPAPTASAPPPTPSAPPPVPASAASPPPRTPKATLLGIPAIDTSAPRVSAAPPPPPPPPRASAAPPVPAAPAAPATPAAPTAPAASAARATSMPPPPPPNANRKATMLGLPSVVATGAAEAPPAIELSSELDSGAFQSLATSDYGPGDGIEIAEPTPNAGVTIDDFDEKPTAIQPSLLDLEAAPAAPADLATDPGIAAALESVDEAPASPFAPTVAAFPAVSAAPATPASSFGPAPSVPAQPTFSHPPTAAAPKRSSRAPIAIVLVLGAAGAFAMFRDGSETPHEPSPNTNVAVATPTQAPPPPPPELSGKPQSAPPAAPEPPPSKPSAPASADVAAPSPAAAAPPSAAATPTPTPTPPPAPATTSALVARAPEASPRPASPAAAPAPSRTAPASTAASRTPTPSTPTAASAPAAPAANPAILLRDEARAHYVARRFREAAAAYERLVAISPNDAGVFAGLGRARLELNDGPGAIAAYRRATQLAPNNAGFFVGLGRGHFISGNRNAAEAALRQALTLDPNHTEAQRGLAALGAR